MRAEGARAGAVAPAFDGPEVPVVLISSAQYLPHTRVAILSVLRNRDPGRAYDIVVLHNDMPRAGQEALVALAGGMAGVSIRPLCVREYLDGGRLDVSGVPHTGVETFSRLLIPDLFCAFGRIVYLDSDLVACADVGRLYDTALPEGVCMAGVPDIDVIGQYCSEPLSGRYYIHRVLGLEDVDRYLQTGVLLLDPRAMHALYPGFGLLKLAAGARLKYADQDVLNIAFHRACRCIDMRWNVVNDCGGFRLSQIVAHAPAALRQAYAAARSGPWIVHYSGFEKPWSHPDTDMADYYREYALLDGQPPSAPAAGEGDGLKRRLKNAARRALPRGSRRRDAIRRVGCALRYRKPMNMRKDV